MEFDNTEIDDFRMMQDPEYLQLVLAEATSNALPEVEPRIIRLKHLASIISVVHGIPAYKIYAILHLAISLVPFFLKKQRKVSLLGLGTFNSDKFEMMPTTLTDIRNTLGIKRRTRRTNTVGVVNDQPSI